MRGPVAVLALSLCACGYNGFEEAHRIHDGHADALVAAAPYPELTPRVRPEPPARSEYPPGRRPVVKLDLPEACRLALKNNLPFLVAGEQLEVQLLSLDVLRRGWWPAAAPLTGSGTYTKTLDGPQTGAQSATLGLSQKLPLGGTLGATYTHTGSQVAGQDAYQGTLTATYTQPLLRNSGHRQAVEEIVAAARTARYARRTYEFNRLGLLVATVEVYFGLLQQEQSIRNFERALERTRQLARQADINEKFGRVTRTDVFRSQLEVTRAESALNDARERLALSRNAFTIDLGIPPEFELELAPATIEYVRLPLGRDEAVALALERNVAWLNARDGFEDARRALAIASNAQLPQLDLTASWTMQTDAERDVLNSYDGQTRAWSVGGTFSIPLDRSALRRDYQAAVITYRQAERDIARARDRVVRDVDAQLIVLRQVELAMEFQRRAISDAEKAARLAEFDYRRGRVTNRDVIEAQDRLLEAQNALQAALVVARIAQLRLLQFVGRLVADSEGRWLK